MEFTIVRKRDIVSVMPLSFFLASFAVTCFLSGHCIHGVSDYIETFFPNIAVPTPENEGIISDQ